MSDSDRCLHALKPPIAKRCDHRFTCHGITIGDPYFWLKDRAYPKVEDGEVLAYLNAENAYYDKWMKHLQADIGTLFAELKARRPERDASVALRRGQYYYQWRFDPGAQYRRWYRCSVADFAHQTDSNRAWCLILDEVELASGYDYFRLGGMAVSPDGVNLAWSEDIDGSERFCLKVKNLLSGEMLTRQIDDTLGSPVWASDSQTLFYLKVNENWRPYQVRQHRLGVNSGEDVVVYEEFDPAYFISIDITQSQKWIVISSGDHVTNELRVLPADDSEGRVTIISARRPGHEYTLDHRGSSFYILTNDEHKNFRLVMADETSPGPENWRSVIKGSDDHYLRGIACFKDYVVVTEREKGLDQIRILDLDHQGHLVQFSEEAYTVGLGGNAEYDQPDLRLHYQSMVTPHSVYDYRVKNRELVALKVRQIPSGYEAGDYETSRLFAPARDGELIPISLVSRKGFKQGPLYLLGYGAYGYALPPSFDADRLSLLDRGFAVAIAHIRGGDDLGYRWYEEGKLDRRMNTFNDFVDVARYLIAEGFTKTGSIAISGGSAGGELMAAVVNQAPELWGAVAAHVPFVDVLNTMLDASLPLTPIEWPEWGNPVEDAQAFEFIRSYSPYDQIKAGKFPPMMVTAGINDPRVTYWEPAKYVAKMRYLKTDDSPLLLKTNMSAGHGGKSGRFESLTETAEEFAFIFDVM